MKFIIFLNKIKDKIGLYAIVLATKRNWSEFYSGNTINEDLVVLPAKKVILPIWCGAMNGLVLGAIDKPNSDLQNRIQFWQQN